MHGKRDGKRNGVLDMDPSKPICLRAEKSAAAAACMCKHERGGIKTFFYLDLLPDREEEKTISKL